MSGSSAARRVALLSEPTQKVLERMRTAAVGDMVPWEELEAITGRPRDAVRDMARTASKRLQNDEKMHFRTCIAVGVERIPFTTVAREELPTQRKRIGAAAGRMLRTTENVILDGMSRDDCDQVLLHQAIAGVTQIACSNEGLRRLRASTSALATVPPFSPREAAEMLFSE